MTPRTAQIGVAAVAALLFGLLAVAVLSGGMAEFDAAVRGEAQALAAPWLTTCVETLTRFGSVAVLAVFTAIAVLVLVGAGRRSDAAFVALLMVGALIVENVVKFSVRRPRPPPFFGTDPTTYSFPSGHALLSLCFYSAMAIVLIRKGAPRAVSWAIAVCCATAIGATRIYLGVHYPSDVLAGYLLAIAWLCGVLAARSVGKF